MSTYRDSITRSDRARAISFVIAVHAALGALLLSGTRHLPAIDEPVRTTLIDVELTPPPPPPPPDAGRAPDKEGAAGRKAEPTPVIAPKPKIVIPARTPVIAAPVAGTGAAANAGAASAGSGPGAGGSGSGRGGGGSGGGIGSAARLVSGGLTRWDYRRLRPFNAPSGQARLAIMVGTDGRVTSCRVNDSSGDAVLDSTLCAILEPRMRWVPARDPGGTPISVQIYYIATWERF
jgi:protein TonB